MHYSGIKDSAVFITQLAFAFERGRDAIPSLKNPFTYASDGKWVLKKTEEWQSHFPDILELERAIPIASHPFAFQKKTAAKRKAEDQVARNGEQPGGASCGSFGAVQHDTKQNRDS